MIAILKLTHFLLTLALFLSISASFESTALAYVDPGSSLLLVQTLGAILSGALFYFRKSIAFLLRRLKRTQEKNESEDERHE